MENIISLADLITRQKLYQAELIDEVEMEDSKMALLYQSIKAGKIKNDEDALGIIYKGDNKLSNLKKLKGRLYNRMINSVFFIDQSGSNYKDIFDAAKTCYKNYAAVKILAGNRKGEVAADIAEKTLRMSKKYEFTDLNFLLSSVLCMHYLTLTKEFNKYEKYSKLKEYYFRALEAETTIEELYASFNLNLSKSHSGLSDEIVKFYKSKIPFIKEKLNQISTSRLILYSYLFLANLYLETKEYKKIPILVNEGLDFFAKKGISSVLADYTLRTRAALANFLLKKYDKAESLFLENLEITEPNTTNWYYTHNLRYSLKLVTKKYQEAYDIISLVFSTKEFNKITHPLLVQLFRVKEAYTHFLIEHGKIDPEQSTEIPLRKFRMGRFLNEVPSYSKDKRGVNISILIIQMLLLIQNKKYDQIIDKLDALNMYSHRYLRSDNTFRSNCFIKMLAKLPDADYHPIRWERYVKKFRDRLDEHPFELSYHNLDLEVIPFETLYDLVVEILEKR